MNPRNKTLAEWYVDQIKETAQGIQAKVLAANGIPLHPQRASELCPIPVYEEAQLSLLSTANADRRPPTQISWAVGGYTYLPAYFKKYRDEKTGRLRISIVVAATSNYCESRFFAAKELMHCFIEDDGYEATDTMVLANDLIESLAIGSHNVPHPRPQTIVDEVAWVGAAEYLVPATWVPLLQRTLTALQDNGVAAHLAHLHVAQLIRVPETVLRARLRNS